MKIYSEFQDRENFNKLRKTRWLPFLYLASGEWSQSPYHQGNIIFDYTTNKRGDRIALLRRSFPRTIVCIAELTQGESIVEAIGKMMFHLWENGGDYIDLVDYYEDDVIDFNSAYTIFSNLVDEKRKQRKEEREKKKQREKEEYEKWKRSIDNELGTCPKPRSMVLMRGSFSKDHIEQLTEKYEKSSYEEMMEKCKTTYLIGLINYRQGIELYIIFKELLKRRRDTPIKLENNVITILPSSEYLDKEV